MEAVVTADGGGNLKHNGVTESKTEDSWPEEKDSVKPTSDSSASEIEDENIVAFPKLVSNKKRKRSKADEVKKGKTKSPRKTIASKKRDLCNEGNCDGDGEEQVKQRSSVKRKEEEAQEQELQLVPFARTRSRNRNHSDVRFHEDETDVVNGSCSQSESDSSDSRLRNDKFKYCRSMTRSLKVTFCS